ncbi:hypothetical protein [Niastella populi]|uniref:Lipocalin-like domain-containing protein n=1 Tax=Niastella populi TaxID=550983 RepID=A0A1V9GAN0_9BACT|nr:hypothetical protein [Niastella populi]OQP67719.1 hypothetical protein A4R26_11720 [Niastella populi]
MRLTYISLLGITAVIACQPAESNKPKASFHRPFIKDSLAGNWIISSVISDRKDKTANDTNWFRLETKIALTAYSFQPNGTMMIDYATPEFTTANWQFNNKSKLLTIQEKDTTVPALSLTVIKYQNDVLTFENNNSVIIPNVTTGEKETIHLQYIAQRLKSNDTIPNLFDPGLNKWRQKPTQAEDDAAIKNRLKESIYYYAGYFANVKGNKIPVFNPEKMLCPIKFYKGGIGRKRFKENDNWTAVFFDNKDAKKAHDMLGHAFDNIKGYPDKGGDYVAEYIIAMKMVADEL